MSKMKKRKLVVGISVVAAAAALALMLLPGSGDGGAASGELYAAVQEGPLVISVEEYGEIVDRKSVV